MKILLVSPGTEDEIDNKVIRSIPYLHARAFNAPHAVAAVAALTPPEHEVQIIDEYIKGPVENFLDRKYFDIIGISFTSNQLLRCLQIAKICKKTCPDSLIVAGGIGVEALIYKNNEDIDIVFHGEAEDTWPAILNEYSVGRHRKVYKNITKPDMSKVPAPRWELIADDIKKYNSVSVQTTRGCPYDCSFCDVIYTYGRNPRSKTIEQILNEIKILRDMGVEMVFFPMIILPATANMQKNCFAISPNSIIPSKSLWAFSPSWISLLPPMMNYWNCWPTVIFST